MCGPHDDRRALVRSFLFLLSGSVSVTALAGVARAQETTTLPEVRVIAPSPVPAATRRPTPATRPARAPAAPAVREQPPAPAPPPEPGLVERDKVPSNIQTLTPADFDPANAPNVPDASLRTVPRAQTRAQ